MSDFFERIKGALYFTPLVIATLAGQPYFNGALLVLQALICFELAGLLAPSSQKRWLLSALIFCAASLGFLLTPPVMGALSLCAMALLYGLSRRWGGAFAALFSLVLLLCLFSLNYILRLPDALMVVVAIACVIIACDVGAYIAGRLIGGPKLAPAISPGKTVSGAFGGLAGAIVTSFYFSPYLDNLFGHFFISGLVIGILAQAGDFYESALKRRLNIKDSSQLIPGHGGLLDRFDGYLFVFPMIGLISLIKGL